MLEVTVSTSLGGEGDTSFASKHRQVRMVNNGCIFGCTSYIGKAKKTLFLLVEH